MVGVRETCLCDHPAHRVVVPEREEERREYLRKDIWQADEA